MTEPEFVEDVKGALQQLKEYCYMHHACHNQEWTCPFFCEDKIECMAYGLPWEWNLDKGDKTE